MILDSRFHGNDMNFFLNLMALDIAFTVCIRYKVSGNPLRSIPETNSTALNWETLYHYESEEASYFIEQLGFCVARRDQVCCEILKQTENQN